MKDFSTMAPRDVEAYLRQSILRLYGDEVENLSSVTSSHGYFTIEVVLDNKTTNWRNRSFNVGNFRKSDVPKIVKALKVLC